MYMRVRLSQTQLLYVNDKMFKQRCVTIARINEPTFTQLDFHTV
jgi:hypothetical protein